jgi:hypothetical protein
VPCAPNDALRMTPLDRGRRSPNTSHPASAGSSNFVQEMKDAPPEPKAARDDSDTDFRDTSAPDYNFHNPYPKKKKEAESAKPAGSTDDFELPAGIQRQYVGAYMMPKHFSEERFHRGPTRPLLFSALAF